MRHDGGVGVVEEAEHGGAGELSGYGYDDVGLAVGGTPDAGDEAAGMGGRGGGDGGVAAAV